jgi:hypothetical protein
MNETEDNIVQGNPEEEGEEPPPLAPVEDADDEESEGEACPDEYEEEYVGRLYDDNDEVQEYMGRIHVTPENINPLKDCGPAVWLEDELDDDMFVSVDPQCHQIQLEGEDRMAAVSAPSSSTTPKPGAVFRKSSRLMDRPDRGPMKNRRLMTAIVEIAGVEAFALFDSGCTIEALSPAFVRIANIKVHQLSSQHSLQLGTVGSKAKFNYGTNAHTSYGGIDDKVYYDIINVDRYDAIIGTQFMRKHGIKLDFENDTICIRGKVAPSLSVGEDSAEFTRRAAMKRELLNEKFRRKESQASKE